MKPARGSTPQAAWHAEKQGASRAGDGCWVFSFGGGFCEATTRRVLAGEARVRAAEDARFLDVVPGLDSLGVHFDPAEDAAAVRAAVADALAGDAPAAVAAGAKHTLPTRFDGPDLAAVARAAGLTEDETAAAFLAPAYLVAAVGFLPHFPYLLGLDPRLATPRRASPRVRVPAGAVAIGADQAGVYPRESPGGWNLIGSTDPALLVGVRPGDRVRFEALP